MWCDGLSCRHDRSLIIDHRCVHLWIDQSRSHNSVCTRHTGLQKWMCWCGLSCIVFSCSRHDWCGCPRKCLLIDGIKHARMSRLLLDSQYCFISIGGLYESVYSAGIGTIFLTFWCWNPRQKDFFAHCSTGTHTAGIIQWKYSKLYWLFILYGTKTDAEMNAVKVQEYECGHLFCQFMAKLFT